MTEQHALRKYKCVYCKKHVLPSGKGGEAPVKHPTNVAKWVHKSCAEMMTWKKESANSKVPKPGKARRAGSTVTGRVLRNLHGLGGE